MTQLQLHWLEAFLLLMTTCAIDYPTPHNYLFAKQATPIKPFKKMLVVSSDLNNQQSIKLKLDIASQRDFFYLSHQASKAGIAQLKLLSGLRTPVIIIPNSTRVMPGSLLFCRQTVRLR